MHELVPIQKSLEMGKRDRMRRSVSEVETFRKCESTEGRFGNFEIVSYAPLLRKQTSIYGFSLRNQENSLENLRGSETPSVINANSNRLLSSKSMNRTNTGLIISPTALEILSNPKLSTSPYQSRKFPIVRREKAAPERVGKVFLSERQSRNIMECGTSYPGAPPATPTPMTLQKTEYIPSMKDIRAQRSLQDRLQSMKNVQKAKLEKRRREAMKQEKNVEEERVKEEKRQQRRMIYALNEIMTKSENARFQEFIQKNGFGA